MSSVSPNVANAVDADVAPDYDEQCRKAVTDLSSLNRVSHRLALVDTVDRLQTVLDKLLPRLLARIGDNHQAQLQLQLQLAQQMNSATAANNAAAVTSSMKQLAVALDKIHAVLIETLSHTMKRVRDDASCQIPALAILQLLLLQQQVPVVNGSGSDGASSESTTTTTTMTMTMTMTIPQSNLNAVDPFTLNLSLAFLTVGLPRMKHAVVSDNSSTSTSASIATMLPGLLVLHGATAGLISLSVPSRRLQAHQIAVLLLQCLSAVATATPPQRQRQQQRGGAGGGAVDSSSTKPTSVPASTAAASTPAAAAATPAPTTPLTAADHIALARTVLVESPVSAAACFDLILDVLLYPNSYNSSSNLPPDGLSQAANERFQPVSSNSNNSNSRGDNWAVALAVGANVAAVKMALLDVIAPHRQWALFVPNHKTDTAAGSNGNGSAAQTAGASGMGLARTVALLVAATGDVAVEVSDRATTYLKIHLDSVRGASANESAMGDPVQLACGLLSLCLGQTHAESILQAATAAVATTGADNISPTQTLGRTEIPTGSESSQLVFSTKRRPVSESTAAAILSFCSSKILDDHPTLLDDASPVAVACLGQLVVKVASKTLKGLTGASGLSALRAKPYIAAAQLLNSLCIRLTVYYDTTTMATPLSSIDNGNEELSSSPRAVVELLAQSLSTACEVLSGASTQRPATGKGTNTSNAGNIAVRDACYGVVCTLSRSRFALAREGYVFTRGKGQLSSSSSNASTKLVVSIETASLLFGCAANEEETLRPRAVAALDALLGACCRVYETEPNKPILKEQATPADTSANPWASAVTTDSVTPLASEDTDGVNVDRAGLSRALLPLIWTAGQTYQPKASRVAAARWSSDLLKDLDLPSACHIMCFLAGDADVTASSIAREGLGLPKHATEEIPTNTDDSVQLPGFRNFAEMVFSSGTGPSTSSLRLRRFWDFSPQGRAAALRFGLLCLLNDIYGGEDHAVGIYLSALTETLNVFLQEGSGISTAQDRSSIDLLDEASTCLFAAVSTSQYARKQLWSEKKDGFAIREIESLCLKAASSRARRHLAGACGRMYEDTDVWEGGPEQVPSLERWLSLSRLQVVIDATAEKLSAIGSNHLVSSQIHGAAFLGAHAARAFRLQAVHLLVEDTSTENLWDKLASIFASLGRGLLHSDEIIGNACADGLGIAFSYEGMDAPLLDSRLYNGSATVLNQLAVALVKFGNGDSTDASRVAKLAKAAGDSLSASTSGSGAVGANATGEDLGLGPARVRCADALFALLGSMAFRKEEEIGLVVGEALASYADAYSPKNVVWGAANLEWPEDFSEDFASQLPPHQHVLYVLLRKIAAASSPHTRTAAAPALLALVARATKGVHSDDSYVSRSLVQSLLEHLDEVQQLFIRLLSDPKSRHLSRESCCLGLAACQGLTQVSSSENDLLSGQTNDELNQRLLRAFGQTTSYSGSALMESSAQAAERRATEREASTESGSTLMETFGVESEVGGASGMGEAALGAYREMASASVSIGRADILYTLLMLSVSHPVWFSEGARERYGASSLLGESSIVASRTNSLEMREALRPHIGKLLPRILRACHDPNKQTREQMMSLWVGLTGGGSESRLAVTQHLLPAVDILITDSASKLWRARVGACGALAEIIVGRDWASLGGGPPVLNDDDLYGATTASAGIRLLRLWRTAMRSLDDVRGAVRDSGEKLARAVRGLTIRLCDPSMLEKSSGAKRGREDQTKHERDATAAAATSLRWLIRHGLNQACSQAVGIAVSTLVEIVGVVRPKILGPILPDLLKSLLMSMSGLEPAALNYLQLRTDDQEGLERIRLKLAQSGPLATAVTKCLDLLPSVNVEIQKAVIPQLDSALRMSAGFATRAATADAVSTLCATCPDAFRFSSPANANPTVRLLRAFYFASERERGLGAKDKMIHALGNLASLCPGSSVRVLAMRACERYNASTGNSDDPASRRAAASTLRAIAVRASNQFADGGNSDIWCRRVLPVAFIGRKDPDAKIASLWKEVWEEGGGAANASDAKGSFSSTLEETLLPHLVHECVNALKDVSWSRRVGGATALSDLCDQGILAPAPRNTNTSKVSVGSASLARSRHRAQASRTALNECLRVLIKPRLWTGKSQVLKAVVKLASKWVSGSADGDVDEIVLFGWDGEASACPWTPLLVSPGQFGNDLFSGDSWFLNISIEDESGDQVDQVASDAMDVDENDAPINFEECDKILGDDDQNDSTDDPPNDWSEVVTFAGLCRLLIVHALQSTPSMSISEEFLPYRAASFHGFRDLLNCLPDGGESVMQRMEIYGETSAKLFGIFGSPGLEGSEKKEPPVLVAGAINSLAACFWDGIGSKDTNIDNGNALELATTLKELGGSKQPAWTVREASAICMAELAAKCHRDVLRQPNLVSTMVACATHALKDRKFWKVRYSGLKILHCLTSRAAKGTASASGMSTGSDLQEKQLTLEALLPHKEEMVRLARASLGDSESKVTALSSEILGNMAWWP